MFVCFGQQEQHTENREKNNTLNRDGKSVGDVTATGAGPTTPTTGSSETNNSRNSVVDITTSSSSTTTTNNNNPEDAMLKRDYVIRELVDTEKDYVRDLGLVVEGYMALMRNPDCDIPMPEDLKSGKDKMVFGNIEAIYEWHKRYVM